MARRQRKHRPSVDGGRRSPETVSPARHNSYGNERLRGNRHTVLAVCGLLLAAIALVFGQTVHHEFVNYDDELYVVDHAQVARGLTAKGVVWAFTTSHASNWHPLTWLSHMLDCQLYGLAYPGGHHLTSVVLHAVTAVLLFIVLLRMTGDLWPSAAASALFAVHPLHVESVAWIAERKDVLSGLFFVLTLAAYLQYVRRPPSLPRYLLVLGVFILGLLSKPTLVTLPFVLLLLDYWPLRRFPRAAVGDVPDPQNNRRVTVQWLLLEKVPLLVLAAACSVLTYVVQATARGSMDHLPLSSRLANAVVSYVAYLGKFVYPAGLAVFYPHPEHALPAWHVAGAGLVLAGISAGVLAWRRRYPYLFVGWLWYLGTLVPVIGLVQVGSQAMADRYSYLTQIGLYLAVAWGVAHVARSSSFRRSACGITACLAFVALSACAWRQVSFWKDSETLWTRAAASTTANYEAHNGLGRALAHRGQATYAIAQYEEALAIKPDYVEAHNNLGNVLADRGQMDAAMGQYRAALQTKPDHAEAHNNLGLAMAGLGNFDAAVEHYQQALAAKPDFAEAHYNLGNALASRGQLDLAIGHYRAALSTRPDFAEAHNNLGTLLARRGQTHEAIAQFREALAIAPGFASARQNLAAVLAEADGS